MLDKHHNLQQKQTSSGQPERKAYYQNKSIVFKFEPSNFQSLYLFPSIQANNSSKTDPTTKYYNMGGHSALFYAHDVAKKIGRKNVKLHPDNDHCNVKFREGLCSIRNLDKFAEKLTSIGAIRLKPKNQDLVVFKLPQPYTEEDVERFRKLETTKAAEVNSLIFSKILYPDVHAQLLDLERAIPVKLKNLENSYREMYAAKILSCLDTILYAYADATAGLIDEKTCLHQMLTGISHLLVQISALNELGLWDVSSVARICRIIGGIKISLQERIKKL